MSFKMNKVSFAVLAFLGLASSATQAQYQNDEEIGVQVQPTRIQSATSIHGCDAGLMFVDGQYWCSSLVPQFRGGSAPNTQTTSYSSSGVGVSEAHSWGVPGMTGGHDAGYDSNGRYDPGNLGSPGPGVPTDSGSGGGGGGSSRVICTHFYAKGEIPKDVWRADLAFTKANLSETTVRGYHAWAIGYVKLMRKFSLAEDIMRPIALHRAQELAYQMGVVNKGSWRGKLARLALEPLCFAIGTFVGASDYMALWKDQPQVLKLLGEQA